MTLEFLTTVFSICIVAGFLLVGYVIGGWIAIIAMLVGGAIGLLIVRTLNNR